MTHFIYYPHFQQEVVKYLHPTVTVYKLECLYCCDILKCNRI